MILAQMRTAWGSPVFEALAEKYAKDFVRQLSLFEQKTFAINLYGDSPLLKNVLKLSINNNVQLIKSISSQHLNAIADIVFQNVLKGYRAEQIVKSIQDYGVTEKRARLIAIDQTAKVQSTISRVRQEACGFEYFQWDTSNDERVRPSHKHAENAVTKYGRGVYRWDDLPVIDGEKVSPGMPIRCFPGSVNVNFFYGTHKAWRYWYTGEMTELITDSGKTLLCTPNHPILTDRGFIPAHLLEEGDNLINVPEQSVNGLNADSNCFHLQIGELFDALRLFGRCESGRGLGGEFDGDIRKGEKIDVIDIEWELASSADSTFGKGALQLLLSVAEETFSLPDEPGVGNSFAVLQGLTLAPDGIVRRAGQFLAFLGRCFTHSDEHCFTAIGLLYSALVKNSSNDVARCIEVFSDGFDTKFPVKQRLDFFKRKILSIVRFSFGAGNCKPPIAEFFANSIWVNADGTACGGKCLPLAHQFERLKVKRAGKFHDGYVYDLTTENGLFIANYTVVSNCRCVAIPVLFEEVKEFQAEQKKNGKK